MWGKKGKNEKTKKRKKTQKGAQMYAVENKSQSDKTEDNVQKSLANPVWEVARPLVVSVLTLWHTFAWGMKAQRDEKETRSCGVTRNG